MQARTSTRRFEPGQTKLIIAAGGAIAILLLGAVLSMTQSSGDQAAIVDRARVDIVRPTPNTRFLEWNVLPGDPRTYPVTSLTQYRVEEWNVLAGDPGTYPVTSLQEYRFRDWNVLPDHACDVQLDPPAYERGTRH
ncbi:hypothetical protein BH23CHL2_BH23CHL2_06940 [soil metagenome]